MLKMDIIKFEAQDVITSSILEPVITPVPSPSTDPVDNCICKEGCFGNNVMGGRYYRKRECEKIHTCPAEKHSLHE